MSQPTLDDILYDLIMLNRVRFADDIETDGQVIKTKESINKLITEAYKKGYIEGGVAVFNQTEDKS